MDKQKQQIEETEKELADMLAEQDDSEDESEKEEDKDSEEEDEDESEDDEDSDDDESDEDDSEDEDEDSDEEEDSDEDEDEEEDSDESDEDEDEDESEDDDSQKGRKPKDGDEMIPKWQLKAALRKQKKELLKDVTKLAQKPSDERDSDDEEVKAIAKKYGFKEEQGAEFIKDLASFVAKRNGLTPEFLKGIDEARKVAQEVKEEAGFEKDFRKNENLIRKLYPQAKNRDIESIKGKLKELAYSKEYAKYRLADIIRLNRKNLLTTRKKSVDGSRIKLKGKVRYDLSNPDSIPFDEMSIEEFEKVSEALASKSRSNRFKKSK